MSNSTNYSYDSNGRLHQLYHTLPTGITYNTLAYDDLGRLSTGYTTKYRKEFQYAAGSGSNTTTTLVSQLSVISSSTGSFPTKIYTFSYDNLGNISQIVGPEGTTNYSYDVLSQLTQANRNNGAQVWNYSCDYFGNLKTRSYAESGVTQESLTYTYGDSNWKDKLTGLSVTRNCVTTNGTYTYDAIGNPTSYFSPSDLSTWTMSWQNGRELATATNGTHTLSYDYDVNGLRTYKIVDGVRHDYFYASGKLLREEWTETENGVDKACSMDFFYDYAGNPYVVFISRGTAHQRFYYMTNLQGDVIGILNTSAELVAEYDYDPYGNLISFTGSNTGTELQQLIGQANPLRYRGYYFDQETGFYYLQSRYYDPSLGRFINADSYASTGQGFLGYNMYAYCGNNPVDREDPFGCSLRPTTNICADYSHVSYTPDHPSSYSKSLKKSAIEIKSKVKESDWKNMTFEQRKSCCEDYFSDLCVLMDISNYTLEFSRTPITSTAGNTNPVYYRITIFDYENTINDYEILGTIMHECYHAYQYNCVDGIIVGTEPDYVIEAWAYTFENAESIPYMQRYTEISAFWYENNLDYASFDGCKGRGYYR